MDNHAARMTKVAFAIVGLVIGVLGVGALLVLWPVLTDILRSNDQMKALQSRSDYPQIAAASISLARSVTNQFDIPVTDSRVPALLKELAPRYIMISEGLVTMEFHGGFDHYGYRVQRSKADSNQWTISFYTENGEKPLAQVTGN